LDGIRKTSDIPKTEKNLNMIYRKPSKLRSFPYVIQIMLKTLMIGGVYQEGSTQLEEPSLTGHPRNNEQSLVTLSSTEAEYYALSECAQEAFFTQNLLMELTKTRQSAIIYDDNQGAIF
jgi:hypothetical protein